MTYDEFEINAETSVTYYATGLTVIVLLDWDEDGYYLMLDQHDSEDEAIQWDAENGTDVHSLWLETQKDIDEIGIKTFLTLDEVNEFVASIDGDKGTWSAGGFYDDEFYGICGK